MTWRFAGFALAAAAVLTAIYDDLEREARRAECIPEEPPSLVVAFLVIACVVLVIGALLRPPRRS